MQILSRDSLPLGGFGGLTEHRLVTDSRVFGGRKTPQTFEGIGNFVYLADAKFNPKGATGMHPHMEIDVITVMIDGRVSHEGSLEHGKSLDAGEVQVQRAGGEGFSHNEVNPDSHKNRLLQLWALPEEAGQPAGYKHYTPVANGITRIYGGNKSQNETFDSHTVIDIVQYVAGQSIEVQSDSLAYLASGTAQFNTAEDSFSANAGDLVRSDNVTITATSDIYLVVIKTL